MEPGRLEKFPSPGRGSGLRALKRARPGELLSRAEPFACTVTKQRLGGVCERCLRRNERLLRCSQCKIARYCDTRCQKEAWQEHKQECKCLKSIEPNFPPDSVRLVGRIVFKLLGQSAACPSEKLYSFSDLQSKNPGIAQHKLASIFVTGDHSIFRNLQYITEASSLDIYVTTANIEELSEEMKEGLRHLAQTLQLYLRVEIQDAFQLLPAIDIFQIFAKVTCNCFTISNGEMQDVGVGLYPSMSLLNHSCDPNCVIVFEGRQLLLRSVREIQIGEELTISYIESLMPSSERQKHLKRQYCFECNCLLCQTQEKDVDMLAGEEKAWKEIKDAVTKVGDPRSQEEWEQVLAMCQALLNNNADSLPDTNIYLLKLLDCAMDACINLRRWGEALLYGKRTLKPYRLITL
ncbi:histone-lysine N-methyltransferase SMYD3 isoform X5 [Lepidochelys kempii]|uniref:histone-lysine N-methyltransferase SMYD3 isoform X5 n=1 Tax=Lepidochelys kempii TaxID=8472 RepID=UPI003C701AC5